MIKINGDGTETAEIKNREGVVAAGAIGQALVVVAAAPDANLEAVVLAADD